MIITSVIMMLAAVSCVTGPKTVDFPVVGTPKTTSIIIEKVELTDTVTSLHIRSYNRPGWWIRIVSETHLVADGQEYEMTGTEGITPDEYLWMPADGDSLFVLRFAPLPRRTKSFDLIEGYEEDAFRLLDVDLTGKPADAYAKGLPRRVRTTSETQTEIPGFVYEIGETTINLHILGYKPDLGKSAQIFVHDFTREQNEYMVELDPETGTGSISFRQYGTCYGFVAMSGIALGSFHIAPGETADIWCDPGYNDYQVTQIRRTDKPVRDVKSLYSEGSIYDCMNNLPACGNRLDNVCIRHLSSVDIEDYKLSADEYTDIIEREYDEAAAILDTLDIHPMTRKYTAAGLKMQAIAALSLANSNRIRSYRRAFGIDWSQPVDYVPDTVTSGHIHRISDRFDLKDPVFEMVQYNSWRGAVDPGLDKMLRTVAEGVQDALNGRLSQEKLSEMQSWDSAFYAQMCEDINARAIELLASGSEIIEPVPDVPSDRLFEAIIAPHKGKVVLVDFWNTWCGPCRHAISHNEPYKNTDLASDQIVWIYIANETSPIEKYMNMLPGISGLHYRLDKEQWEQLCKDFKLDGIPSYVLVEKDGSYALRNDFLDHTQMLNTLKEALK